MKEDHEIYKKNKKKFPKVVKNAEIMSCHNGRSSISIQIHKKYTSFLNSKGKYFFLSI